MSRALVEAVNQQNPRLLQTNMGSTNFRFLQLLVIAFRSAGMQAEFVAKTAGDRGKYVPPGFGQHQVRGLDGALYTIVGVSHDALYINGRQHDVIGSASYEETPFGTPAHPAFEEVPRHDWRNSNPPLPHTLEVMPVDVPSTPNPPQPPPRITPLEWPPRDLVGRFFGELNDRYKAGGRENRVPFPDEDRPALYVDNEGLFVWLSEFMRHYVGATGTAGERYLTARDKVLADIDKAWPR